MYLFCHVTKTIVTLESIREEHHTQVIMKATEVAERLGVEFGMPCIPADISEEYTTELTRF